MHVTLGEERSFSYATTSFIFTFFLLRSNRNMGLDFPPFHLLLPPPLSLHFSSLPGWGSTFAPFTLMFRMENTKISERVPYQIVIKWTSELRDGHECLKYSFRNNNRKVLKERKNFFEEVSFSHIYMEYNCQDYQHLKPTFPL